MHVFLILVSKNLSACAVYGFESIAGEAVRAKQSKQGDCMLYIVIERFKPGAGT